MSKVNDRGTTMSISIYPTWMQTLQQSSLEAHCISSSRGFWRCSSSEYVYTFCILIEDCSGRYLWQEAWCWRTLTGKKGADNQVVIHTITCTLCITFYSWNCQRLEGSALWIEGISLRWCASQLYFYIYCSTSQRFYIWAARESSSPLCWLKNTNSILPTLSSIVGLAMTWPERKFSMHSASRSSMSLIHKYLLSWW